ncbi:MAG: AAA family ATPase [Alphaproteobacteria bacterium]|jgi:chromosome partitioning protein|nr:AAA family ATPase [Alphaproteobacteria bacterium]
MQVLAFASQKGGSGKTTLAGHIAVEAERCGAGPVAVVDTDPQGSLAEWWNEREAETPLFARTTVQQLDADMDRMKSLGINLLVIDTPPAITSTILKVVGHADLVVIPARPSPHDLRAAGATVELVESLEKPLVFVMNAATPRARITSEAVFALSQHGTLAPAIIHHRTDFAAAMIDGRTVMELSGSDRSSGEISALWSYLSNRLNRSHSRTMIPAGSMSVPAQSKSATALATGRAS